MGGVCGEQEYALGCRGVIEQAEGGCGCGGRFTYAAFAAEKKVSCRRIVDE
jgi:hypothetical protein